MKSVAYRGVNILEKFKFQPTKNAAYHGRISSCKEVWYNQIILM